MKKLIYSLLTILAVAMTGCIEDGFTTSPTDAPVAGVDTLRLGTVFTDQRTPTFKFTIHNRASKSVALTSVAVGGADAQYFRICVDGLSGSTFSDVEIRAKDSVMVLVDALLPEGGHVRDFAASVDFSACGVQRSVRLEATGRDAVRLADAVIGSDMRLTADKPYIVDGTLTVTSGASLTIKPGAEICFHDGAAMVVRGSLRSEGTAQQPVSLAGDRTGNVVADISFDIMSRQWEGIYVDGGRIYMSHTDMRNTWTGLALSNARAELINSRLHNAAECVLAAESSTIDAAGCEFAEAGISLVSAKGGTLRLNHCTLANNYLFSAIAGPALELVEPESMSVRLQNCIIYGLGADLSQGDFAGMDVRFERCLLRSDGSDDENFINCMWDSDPLYYTVRADYIFDYRLQPESPAATAADPALTDSRTVTDAYGTPRGSTPALGAYALTPAQP